MENNPFNEKYGRKVPYKVPVGFFDTITEKTLQAAKKRRQQTKKKYLAVWLSAAASLLAVLMFAGLHQNWFVENPKAVAIAEPQADTVKWVKEPSVEDQQNVAPGEPATGQQPAADNVNDDYTEETFENLLASLTKEELLYLSGQISAELYLNDLIEE